MRGVKKFLSKNSDQGKMSKEAEKAVKISPKKLEKIKRKLAEFEALKKELGWDEKEGNLGVTNRALLFFYVR